MARLAAESFFTNEEKDRIEAAVREVEKRTSGEVVPMVVSESYDYPRSEIIGAGCSALALAVTLSWAFGNSSVWGFLPIFLLAYLPFKVIIRQVPSLKKLLISQKEIAEEVEERALVAFIENGLHQTREGTGILILLSLFEHRVYVLADHGINHAAPQETWDKVVQMVTDGIHQQRACDALCEAIAFCGDLLAKDFPPRHDDTDELPNMIVDKN
jgi:putative membrane protein